MKKLFLLLVVSAGLLQANAQEPVIVNADGPKIQFVSEVIDYGTIQMGADGVREFKFKNAGKEVLVISDAKSSCGCLIATAPKEPIAPGKSGVIKVQYDTKRAGRFEKTITVISNDSGRPTLVLKVKGEVLAPK